MILSLPTASTRTDDILIWHFDKGGVYSVRSGYKLGRVLVSKEGISGTKSVETWWKLLWQLKIPPKVKVFIWKACLSWIPTMGNLSKKGMAVDDLCPICSRGRESTLHAIWNCSKLKQVRSNVPFMSNNKWCDNASALDFLLFHTNILSIAELEMLCVILWRCWWRRNQIIHQAGVRSDEIVIDWAENFLKEFRNAYERNTDVSTLGSKKVLQNSGWKRPTEGVFKINTDAAFHSIIKLIGFGIVIRNYDGEVMGCSTQSISANFTPQVAEAYAMLRGVQFAIDTGLLPAVVESDAKTVVDLVNADTPPLADIGLVISDITNLCKHHNIRVCFAPRCTNMVAHSLAKAPPNAEDRFYLEDYPPFVENYVLADKPL